MIYSDDEFGFTYGPIKVERIASDNKNGWVALGLETCRRNLILHVTKTGLIRFQDRSGNRFELVPNKGKELK